MTSYDTQATTTGRIFLDEWSPEYGPALDFSEERNLEDEVDTTVETDHWRAIAASGQAGFDDVALVDGVRRIDARLTLEDLLLGPVPGLVATFGVGAVLWHPRKPKSEFTPARAQRMVVLAKGQQAELDGLGGLQVSVASVVGEEQLDLVKYVHEQMRSAEAELVSELAQEGRLVVADGPVDPASSAGSVVGFIKSQHAGYLSNLHSPLVGQLAEGERTPIFSIGGGRGDRYSWYLSLAEVPNSYSWAGIARCETAAARGLEAAVELADATATLLPTLASKKYIDPRAPQNLVPIAALERQLRKSMGDSRMVSRLFRQAISQGQLRAGSSQPEESAEWAWESAEDLERAMMEGTNDG